MNLKNHMSLTFALLNMIGFSYTMLPNDQLVTNPQAEKLITLPSTQILNTRLRQLGLQSYLEKCHVDAVLGGQQKTLKQLAFSIEESLNIYDRSRASRPTRDDTCLKKQEILEAILQDSPEDIADLERTGDLYTTAYLQS